jgi:hypothetical protein
MGHLPALRARGRNSRAGHAERGTYAVVNVGEQLGVPPSSFYAWRNRGERDRMNEDHELTVIIRR